MIWAPQIYWVYSTLANVLPKLFTFSKDNTLLHTTFSRNRCYLSAKISAQELLL